jgi:hypothetical protein
MIGKRTRNALAKRLLKVKTAKSLVKWLDVLNKKDVKADELLDIWRVAVAQGHSALLEKMPNMILDEKLILHLNCMVHSDALLHLVDKMASKALTAKEAQKVFKNIHCADINRMSF